MDNDAAGQTAARKIHTMLCKQFAGKLEVKSCVPREKDFNEQLIVKLKNEPKPPSRGTRESTLVR